MGSPPGSKDLDGGREWGRRVKVRSFSGRKDLGSVREARGVEDKDGGAEAGSQPDGPFGWLYVGYLVSHGSSSVPGLMQWVVFGCVMGLSA